MNNNEINFQSTKRLLHDSKYYYIICTDNIGNYSYINNHYADSFKHIHADLVGQPYHITMHPDDTKVCEEVGGKCYGCPGKLFPATIRKHDGKGGYIITQWEFILMEEDGAPSGIFCLGYDITEYETVKVEVKTIHKDLNDKNERLGEIAFEQSHIVRAPLASMIGLVALLRELSLGDKATEILDMLDVSTTRLDNVIKAIVNKTDI